MLVCESCRTERQYFSPFPRLPETRVSKWLEVHCLGQENAGQTPSRVTMFFSEVCQALSHLTKASGSKSPAGLQAHSGRSQLHPALCEHQGSMKTSGVLLSSWGPGSRAESIFTLPLGMEKGLQPHSATQAEGGGPQMGNDCRDLTALNLDPTTLGWSLPPYPGAPCPYPDSAGAVTGTTQCIYLLARGSVPQSRDVTEPFVLIFLILL